MARPTGKGIAKNNIEGTKEVVKDLTKGSIETKDKDKYRVSIVFDGYLENEIRETARENGMPVATYIKWCVMQQIHNHE